jgi:threonine aldolase
MVHEDGLEAMTALNRRRFLQLGSAATTGLGLGVSVHSQIEPWRLGAQEADASDERRILLSGDGLGLTPRQSSQLLVRLLEEKGIAPDSYSLGGVVEELETAFARVLGKERAIFMPTGTLANHLAVRALANGPSRVVVQEESHLYQDEGDCAQTLSNLTLMPLAPGRATFTAGDVQRVIDQTTAGRVVSRVSVISIETPVRRRQGETFDAAELGRIIELAGREGIRLHLDGARLFLQAAYTRSDVAAFARPFDTVYVSLYKYFNAESGAILAGPRDVIDGMYHVRRMFGGGLSSVWPFAAIALHYLPGFGDRFGRAVQVSEEFIKGLQRHGRFTIERIPAGTNVFRLRVAGTDPAAFQKRLAARGVRLAAPQRDTFLIGVNETFNRTTAAALTDAFVAALAV